MEKVHTHQFDVLSVHQDAGSDGTFVDVLCVDDSLPPPFVQHNSDSVFVVEFSRSHGNGLMMFFVLETIRTGAMRVIHIPVKTEETQRLRIKFVLYCPICALDLNQTS